MKTIFATEKGRTQIVRVDKDAGIFGRFGKPEGENLKRVIHELLATESYIWFAEQGREVLWFVHENQLKRGLGRKRWDRVRQNYPIPIAGESTGDYKICLADPKTWSVDIYECEVAIKYERRQIIQKPKNMKWFCLTKGQARMIEALTGEKAVILREFIEREQLAAVETIVEKTRRSGENDRFAPLQEERKERIVDILRKLGGGCTSRILARCLGVSYSFIKNQRFNLMGGQASRRKPASFRRAYRAVEAI